MMARVSRFVLAHRVWVGVFWLVVTVIGIATSSTTINRLSTKFSVPGREGFETSARILALYGISNENDALVPVVRLPAGSTVDKPGVIDQLKEFDGRIRSVGGRLPDGQPAVKIASFASTGDGRLVSGDRRTTYSVVFIPPPPPGTAFDVPAQEKAIRALVNGATVAGGTARLTGIDELISNNQGNEGPVVRMLMVPALVSLFGRWNWWLPHVPARLIRVHPSEPVPERRRPVQPQEA